MKRTAVFPGSFDPFTLGHEDIVRRALPLFDALVIAIGHNTNKNYYFPLAKRKEWIERVFKGEVKVRVEVYEGLTVNFCNQQGANYILRGLRNTTDFEFERSIAQMNTAMRGDIETIFMITSPALAAISSTIVREIVRSGGNVTQFVPKAMDLLQT